MRSLAWILLLGMVAVAAADDEVKLKNGDRITGKVTGLDGGKLTIDTPEAGAIKIDWTQIVSVKTDHPVKVKLATGELLEGKVDPGNEGRLKIETQGAAAPVEVDLTKIKAINEPPVTWHGKISAAGKITDGNTHNESFIIAGEATRETEQDLIMAKAIFRYGKSGQTLTERNSYGIGKYDYKITQTFYAYVSEELSSDTFKDISLESITSAGVGYVFVKSDPIDFSLEAGLAYTSDNFDVQPDDSYLGARIAASLRLALPLHFEFKDNFTIYPNFKDSQNYHFRNEASLGTAIGAGWDLLGGVITEYYNEPGPGLGRVDDTYFVGLGYTF
jgi:putative salt-induced outer membrane protein YdiY